MLQRLDKYVSTQKCIPRKDARKLIYGGEITVNGEIVKTSDRKIDPTNEIVEISGERVDYRRNIYIMLNKPKGVLSASNDKTRTTAVDLVREKYPRKELFTVGRLDKDTTGLLLVTDDGDFAHKVISPKSGIVKQYYAVLDGKISDGIIKNFEDGIILADKTVCLPAKLERADKPCHCRVFISEGKYHQVKRMFGSVGLGVLELKREKIGNLSLDPNLLEGDCRELISDELLQIYE